MTMSNKHALILASFLMISGTAVRAADAAGNPAAGKAVFAKCMICHSVEPGVNKLGPSLNGVVGRKAGTLAGFDYSPAMKSAKITWTPQKLDTYLTNPRAMVAGTKMIFAGLSNPADRANVIAYLQKPK